MSRHRPAFGVLVIGLALVTGCPAQDGAEREEAGRVSRAVDALRNADNTRKSNFLRALRDEPCTDSEVCAVRSTCIAAYELHLGSLEAVARAITQVDGGDPLVAAAALGAAKNDLDRARQLSENCTRTQGELIRHRRLR